MRTTDELQAFKEGFDWFCKRAGLAPAQTAAVVAAACSLGGDVATALRDTQDGKAE